MLAHIQKEACTHRDTDRQTGKWEQDKNNTKENPRGIETKSSKDFKAVNVLPEMKKYMNKIKIKCIC